jgi:hypothetical protein
MQKNCVQYVVIKHNKIISKAAYFVRKNYSEPKDCFTQENVVSTQQSLTLGFEFYVHGLKKAE